MSDEQPSFQSDVDWSDLDELAPGELERILDWYATSHGDGDVQLTPFVPFFARERPGAFKRYRRQAVLNRDPDGLPTVAVAFLMQHSYMLSHNELGVYYTTICARNWGATRDEVLDALQFGFVESGPLGGNAAGGRAADYLREWPADEPRRTGEDPWPAAWRTGDPGAATGGATDSPFYLQFIADHGPHVLEPLRARYEHAFAATALPRRVYPILRLHGAATNGLPEEIRQTAEQARAAGVTHAEAFETLAWAFIAVPETRIELIARACAPVFDDWD